MAATTAAPKLVKLPAHAKRGEALAGNKIPTARRVVAVRTRDSISAATVNLALTDARERNFIAEKSEWTPDG